MTNDELLKKMSQDMNMTNFSHYRYDFYIRKTKEIIKLRIFKLDKFLINEKIKN